MRHVVDDTVPDKLLLKNDMIVHADGTIVVPPAEVDAFSGSRRVAQLSDAYQLCDMLGFFHVLSDIEKNFKENQIVQLTSIDKSIYQLSSNKDMVRRLIKDYGFKMNVDTLPPRKMGKTRSLVTPGFIQSSKQLLSSEDMVNFCAIADFLEQNEWQLSSAADNPPEFGQPFLRVRRGYQVGKQKYTGRKHRPSYANVELSIVRYGIKGLAKYWENFFTNGSTYIIPTSDSSPYLNSSHEPTEQLCSRTLYKVKNARILSPYRKAFHENVENIKLIDFEEALSNRHISRETWYEKDVDTVMGIHLDKAEWTDIVTGLSVTYDIWVNNIVSAIEENMITLQTNYDNYTGDKRGNTLEDYFDLSTPVIDFKKSLEEERKGWEEQKENYMKIFGKK